MHNLKEIKVLRKAIELSALIYVTVSNFPMEEKYGLTSQIRRSAVSIASNIAEGAGRFSTKEFIYFLGIANGSSYELQTQLMIAHELKLIEKQALEDLLSKIEEIQKMIFGFCKKLKKGLA